MTAAERHPASDLLLRSDLFAGRRAGRFLLVELLTPHRVVSTSAVCGGQREDVSFLVNHQSCEAAGDVVRYEHIARLGPAAYHAAACAEIGVPPDRTALMGTAANMAYAARGSAVFEELRVDAFATAGVAGNAARAGDPARWVEGADGRWRQVEAEGADDRAAEAAPREGTINVILLLDCPVTPAAQARAAVTLTEAKSAALAELAAPSRYSPTIATGTGTDQFCLAAPLDPHRTPRTATGPHAKLGELIGRAVIDAVKEALRWQNGLEPSMTRGLFHALGRFGVTEPRAPRAPGRAAPGRAVRAARPQPERGVLRARRRRRRLRARRRARPRGVRDVARERGRRRAAAAGRVPRLRALRPPPRLARVPRAARAGARRSGRAGAARARGRLEREVDLSPSAPDDPVELVLRARAPWSAKWT